MYKAALALMVGLMLSVSGNAWGATNASGLPACPSSQDVYRHNCFGTYNFANGDKYVGEHRDGLANGQGTYNYANGDKYVGEFKDDLANGQGTFTWVSGNKYVGEHRDDLANGQGTFTWASGNKYVGEHRDDLANGQGTFTWANGDKYVGEFKDDLANGQGTFTWANGDKYVGEFKDDKRHGQGTYNFANGDKYVGEYKDGLANGQGTFTWANGDKYVGEYKDDLANGQGTFTWANGDKYVGEYKDDLSNGPTASLQQRIQEVIEDYKSDSDNMICSKASKGYWVGDSMHKAWKSNENDEKYVSEAKRRGLNCGVKVNGSTQVASTTPKVNKPVLSSAELDAERQKRMQLEQKLAALEAQQKNQQQTISSDTQIPLITITSASSSGPSGTIEGRVTDNEGVGEVRVDGKLAALDTSGNFTASTYVPEGGVNVLVEAFDLAGLSSSMTVRLDRSALTVNTTISFDRLNPLGRKVAKNRDALALIVGVDNYERTQARAIFADSDAKVFADYASEKLGIPGNRIKTLVNDGADEQGMLLAVKKWLSRSVKQGDTDVYVFFAGHGLASDDGKQMYLLPYDGSPELLEKTAILREELFDDIASANPRSVTVFLDTCYSGTTRGTDTLIASRPIVLKALKQSLPDNFTVLTAAAGDQTAKPLEEAKHGMFSYFLMKGMEGDADANQDNQITAGELHQYVQSNVVQQSSGSQTPELQGDADRVLVQFQ